MALREDVYVRAGGKCECTINNKIIDSVIIQTDERKIICNSGQCQILSIGTCQGIPKRKYKDKICFSSALQSQFESDRKDMEVREEKSGLQQVL